ncbi:MAG TPA: MATE family efflux transporter [Lachnospiraceae bacterium]|nr:MATE family efflux transporter [Lachnospiraceae bacterium]
MIKNKTFYKSFFSMWIILVLQNIITLSVNLADNIMLGAYSEVSLSGVAAANQIQFVYQQLITAIGEGAVVLATQYYGKKQMEPIRILSSIGMHTALVTAALLFFAVSLFPRQLLGLFVADPAIIDQGAEYVRIIRYTYLFFAITQLLLAVLRSMGIVHIALILSVCTLLINCGINYTLIYGHFGAPRLGVTGAAIGTLTARIAELLVLIFYIYIRKKDIHLRDYFRTDTVLRRDYFRIMLPLLLASSLWGLNSATQNAILGHMTDRAIAANSVASTLFLMVKSTGMGSASAASFFVGKTIGEGNEKGLTVLARTLQTLFVGIGVLSGIGLYFLRIPVLSLYRLEPETMSMANTFLVILSVICVGMSYQMPTNIGIVRGGGDTKYVMKMDLISIWGIVIPISFIMAFWVKASPVVVVCCLNADQIFKCVPAFLKCNFGHWAKKLTR